MNTEESVREPSPQLMRIDAHTQLAKGSDLSFDPGNSSSALVQLTARLFFRDDAPRVIGLVSCKSHEGVSSLGQLFRDFLAGVGARVTLMPAADCVAWSRGRGSFPAAAFGSRPGASESFMTAKNNSDVLLIDCASLETSPAVFMLASHVDGIVLVVEDGRNSSGEMQKAVKLIKDTGGVVLGVVLTKHRRLLPGWLHNLFSRRIE